MRVNGPVAVVPRCQLQLSAVPAPSGSVSAAVNGKSRAGVSGDSVTIPASSRLVTLMVTGTEASTPTVSAAIAVIEYESLVS